jgi:hypothetical protein
VALFCVGLAALAFKLGGVWNERAARRARPLPAWDGKPVPCADAGRLASGLLGLPPRLLGTWLVRRVAAALDFVRCRGTADQLDDQLRALSDADALAVEGSYGLTRFITWAIPILGFLGTVVGITDAVAGVTPEKLEKSMSQVTDGLATAFDTTALALALTMVLMFLTFAVERLEQGALDAADRYAEEQLAHRFERGGHESGDAVAAVRQNTQVLLDATEKLVQRQAEVWSQALAAAEERWADAGRRQEERLTSSLSAALTHTLEAHEQRLAALEQRALAQQTAAVERLHSLTAAQAELARAVADQTEALARLQDGGGELTRLQETLARNLEALAGAGAFEQAVHSLTAAIHLLTARAGPRAGAAA